MEKGAEVFSKQNPQLCDDGIYAEAFSMIVTDLFANKWKDFDKFLKLAHSDKKFYDFALNHIDHTVDPRVLEHIWSNTKEKCPNRCQCDLQSAQ